jgi:hypothetical protein
VKGWQRCSSGSRRVISVACQVGHGAEPTVRTLGHVIEELEDSPRVPAE